MPGLGIAKSEATRLAAEAGGAKTVATAGSRLAQELCDQIFNGLPLETLFNCRLLSKVHGHIATAYAFRHVSLVAVADACTRFINIARSETLRPYVRQVTCDTYLGPDHDYGCNQDFTFPRKFFDALSYVRFFSNLQRLDLRFSEYCDGPEVRPFNCVDIEDSPDVRYRVLDTIFHCWAGTWERGIQEETDLELDLNTGEDESDESEEEQEVYKESDGDSARDDMKRKGDEDTQDKNDRATESSHAMLPISTLTICNLADFDDERLTESETFRRVMESSITDLKMLITRQIDEAAPEHAFWYPEVYELMDNLPRTWLSPSVAKNLTVLSLYSRDHWGWCPRMDFRCVNPGTGPDAGFPNLRELALGSYVFSHEWQIGWIASLGKGKLRRLYLDDCPILCEAMALQPLDSGETEVTNLDTGEAVLISDDMYPRSDQVGESFWDAPNNPVQSKFPLRWYKVLKRWEDSMPNLEVFRMGHGSAEEMTSVTDVDDIEMARLSGNEFLWYDRPGPQDDDVEEDDYKNGVGLDTTDRTLVLQYIYFNVGIGPSPYCDLREGCLEDEVHSADDEALGSLMSTLKRRREGACV